MRFKRIIWFFIMIAIGAAGGLAYGWVLNPVKYVNTPPETLRADYKADYVLMVAEIYHSDHNLTAAAQRLAFLGSRPPAQVAAEAVVNAEKIGFAEGDLETLRQFSQVLTSPLPSPMPSSTPEKQP